MLFDLCISVNLILKSPLWWLESVAACINQLWYSQQGFQGRYSDQTWNLSWPFECCLIETFFWKEKKNLISHVHLVNVRAKDFIILFSLFLPADSSSCSFPELQAQEKLQDGAFHHVAHCCSGCLQYQRSKESFLIPYESFSTRIALPMRMISSFIIEISQIIPWIGNVCT